MAVAMEVAWRAGGVGELGSTSGSSTPPGVSIQDVEASLKMKNNAGANKINKRAWGADAHKLVQLMMNPLQQQQQQQQLHAGGELEAKKVADEEEEEEVTLDLLGPSSPPIKLKKLEEKDEVEVQEVRELESRSPEFLELEPADQPLPLPSGWEKCLDLKTGKLYFVNKSTQMTNNPEINNPCCKHEFLNTKLKSSSSLEEEEEEEEELEDLIQAPTCPQLAPISSKPPLLAFSTGRNQLWNLQLNIIKPGDHHHARDQEFSNSKFALDLNLTASGSTSPSHHQQSQQQQQQVEQLPPESSSAAVCTMEMVQRALNRAEKAMGKREMQAPKNSHHHRHHNHHHHHSAAASSSSSAHVGAMSEAAAASTSSWSPNSTTSSSNSSSTSSRSSSGLLGGSGAAQAAAATTTTTTKGGTLEVLKEGQVDVHDALLLTVPPRVLVTSELGVCEGEESKEDSLEKKKVKDGKDSETSMVSGQLMLVMGACTRCLMYVMPNKCDPKCPRCESQVPLDFTNASNPPPSKRQRVELLESSSSATQADEGNHQQL